jgi:hypothetical protein
MLLALSGGTTEALRPTTDEFLEWRRDGKELFYMAPNQTLMAVAVKSNPTNPGSQPAESVVCHSHQVDGDSGGGTPLRRRSRWTTFPDQQCDGRGTVCASDNRAQLVYGF